MKFKNIKMKSIFFFLLFFNLGFSQNNSELIDRVKFIQINDSVIDYLVEGLVFQKQTCLKEEGFQILKKTFDTFLNKKKYSLIDSNTMVSFKNNNVTKNIYENPMKKKCIFYDYTNSNNSKNRISILNYSDYSSFKFDSIAKYIIDEQISNKSKIDTHKNFADFDGIKLNVDSTKSFHDNYAHGIQSINGYKYSFFYFKTRSDVEKYMKLEVKALSQRLPGFKKEEYEVEINQNQYDVKQLFGNHLYGNKNDGYKTIFDNFLITYIKKGDKYLFIKAYRGKIYDKKEVIMIEEFVDVLKQISLMKS